MNVPGAGPVPQRAGIPPDQALPPLPGEEEEAASLSSLGPVSAELLVVCLDPAESLRSLVPFLEAQGIDFSPGMASTPAAGRPLAFPLIAGRLTAAMAALPRKALPTPPEMEGCGALLREELQAMDRLRLVLALGVSAHIAVLSACGVPLSRLDFRPGRITRLPDGLLLADACHLPSEEALHPDLLPRREAILEGLMPRIREALRPDA